MHGPQRVKLKKKRKPKWDKKSILSLGFNLSVAMILHKNLCCKILNSEEAVKGRVGVISNKIKYLRVYLFFR